MPSAVPVSSSLPGRRGARPGLGFRLGRIAGVDIAVDVSVLFIFALIVFDLAMGVFPRWHPSWSTALDWSVATMAAILFFGSILLHELSHALVGRLQGIPISRITLFVFGGMAHMTDEPSRPKAELRMAIVGPFTSLVVGFFSALAGTWLATRGVSATITTSADAALLLRDAGPIATLFLWLGPVNLMLGLFNLVPGFPLDGGRILRAVLWWSTKDFERATRWASRGGQLVAWLLIAWGVIAAFSGQLGQGLWLILIGWFLNAAAIGSYEQVLVRRALVDVPIARLMRIETPWVPPDLTVDRFVRDRLMTSEQHSFPVESQDGVLLGMVSLADVRKVDVSSWDKVTVSQIMTPAEQVVSLLPSVDAREALDVLARRDVEQLPVLENQRLLGTVSRSDLVRWVALREQTFGRGG